MDVPEDSKRSVQIGGGIWARASTFDKVANGLVYMLEQPVVDETGIKGHYDFRLQFDNGTDAAEVASAMAVLRQAGLKLESCKVPVEMVIIESAERHCQLTDAGIHPWGPMPAWLANRSAKAST
jgi:uncharacterized protein (TIGR03435 family)